MSRDERLYHHMDGLFESFHVRGMRPLAVLDLGCGNAAVALTVRASIKKAFGDSCIYYGIDIKPEANFPFDDEPTADKLVAGDASSYESARVALGGVEKVNCVLFRNPQFIGHDGAIPTIKMLAGTIPVFLSEGGTVLFTFHAEMEYQNIKAVVVKMNQITHTLSGEDKFILSALERSKKSELKARFFTSRTDRFIVPLDGKTALMSVGNLSGEELVELEKLSTSYVSVPGGFESSYELPASCRAGLKCGP